MYIEERIDKIQDELTNVCQRQQDKILDLESKINYLANRLGIDAALALNSEAVAIYSTYYPYSSDGKLREEKSLVCVAVNEEVARNFISNFSGQYINDSWVGRENLSIVSFTQFLPLIEKKSEL